MKKKFFVLWLAGVVSTFMALPYVFTLQRSALENVPIPLWQVALAGVVQAAVLLAVTVFLGLKLSQSLRLPGLVLFEQNAPFKQNIQNILKLAVPLGVATGIAIKLGDFLFSKSTPELWEVAKQIPFWKVLLVAPYGGIVEELLMRLFLVSLFAWVLGKIFRSKDIIKNNYIMWVAIVVAAVIFGLGHLPATATLTSITPVVITRAIVLNGIGGLVFGWLYWKRGLEYAILAHFTTDIVLLAIIPALIK